VKANPIETVQNDVVGPIWAALVCDDSTGTRNFADRRPVFVVALPTRCEQSHGHRRAAAVEAVLYHLDVPGLEEMER
jgi:hypothetical protein